MCKMHISEFVCKMPEFVKCRLIFLPEFVCKMHIPDLSVVFYIHERIVFANIAKIKCWRIKDSLQYCSTLYIHFEILVVQYLLQVFT